MEKAFVGLGANLGARRQNILHAWQLLTGLSGNRELILSSPYLTKPQGMRSTNWFMNGVGLLETALAAEDLLAAMLRIETELGRKRKDGSKLEAAMPADRTVDLDLLFYGDLICSGPELTLPHPALAKRLFVLAPLAEIAPDHRHPQSGQTVLEMYEALQGDKPTDSLNRTIMKTAWREIDG